jgi:hypothetical protein
LVIAQLKLFQFEITLSVESFPFWSLVERVLTGKILTGKLPTGKFSIDKVV